MKIETKFNVYDDIWFMNNNIPMYAACNRIIIEVNELNIKHSTIDIFYYPQRYVLKLKEEQCFKTKQELIDSL